VHETAQEIEALQKLLDESAAHAGPHLRNIITDDRRLNARELCDVFEGMRLLVVATVTSDGRPLVGPVDGYLIHGVFYFSSGHESVRMRHLAKRPSVSFTHLPGEELAITVHGRAELFDIMGDEHPELRHAMLEYYLPKQGPAFEEWLNHSQAIGARVIAERIFTFRLEE
jgi:uncharacterized pyridoxamine 5'-phosphate oxidase family protein